MERKKILFITVFSVSFPILIIYLSIKNSSYCNARDEVLINNQEQERFTFHDKNFKDEGYLLISRFSNERDQNIIELIKIDGPTKIFQWTPPVSKIIKKSSFGTKKIRKYRVQHPFLLDDGSVIFHSGEGDLVRLDACDEIKWIVHKYFHHSIEIDEKGHFIVPVKLYNEDKIFRGLVKNQPLDYDEGYAVVAMDGTLLETRSIYTILFSNELQKFFEKKELREMDNIHLNDAQPIKQNFGTAVIGDIVFSSRRMSAVFMYRPKTNKIIWAKKWRSTRQHDVNILPDGSVSVFMNSPISNSFYNFFKKKRSQIAIYDPATDSTKIKFEQIIEKANIFSETQGRLRILSNGDAFIESQNQSRILRISQSNLRWEYKNVFPENENKNVHWSRYMMPSQVNDTKFAIETCPEKKV